MARRRPPIRRRVAAGDAVAPETKSRTTAVRLFMSVFLTIAMVAATIAVDQSRSTSTESEVVTDEVGETSLASDVSDAADDSAQIDLLDRTPAAVDYSTDAGDAPPVFDKELGAPDVLPVTDTWTADPSDLPQSATITTNPASIAGEPAAEISFDDGTTAALIAPVLAPGTELVAEEVDGALKTTYVLQSADAADVPLTESIAIEPGWTAEQGAGGTINVLDADGNVRLEWTGGPVWDASGAESTATLRLESLKNGLATAAVVVPENWLSDASRSYPVSVDPIINPISSWRVQIIAVGNGSMPSETQPGYADLRLQVNNTGGYCWAFQIERKSGSTWVDHVGIGNDWIVYEDNCDFISGTLWVTGVFAVPPNVDKTLDVGTQYRVKWRLARQGTYAGAHPSHMDETINFTVKEPPVALGPAAALTGQSQVDLVASDGAFIHYEWALAPQDAETSCHDAKLSGTTTAATKRVNFPNSTGKKFLWCVRGRVANGTGLPFTAWSPALIRRDNSELYRFFGSDPLFETHEGVNAASGNWHFDRTDVSMNGVADGLAVRRSYNSQNELEGSFGRGFSTVFDTALRWSETLGSDINKVHCLSSCQYIEFRTETTIRDVVHPDGSRERFRIEVESFKRDTESRWTITSREAIGIEGTSKKLEWISNTWRLTAKDGSYYQFDTSGRLTEIRDSGGAVLQFVRTSGRVTQVKDKTSERVIHLGWKEHTQTNGSKVWRVDHARVTAPNSTANRYWRYDYADNGNQLIEACDSRGANYCERYDWTPNKLAISKVYNKAGDLAIDLFYFPEMRVKSLKLRPDAGTVNETKFAYTSQIFRPDAATTVTDARGNEWKYKFNANGQLTEKDIPDIHTKRSGLTTYEYDDKGRRTKAIVPFYNDNNARSTLRFYYDDNGNLTRENDGGGLDTHYHYDSLDRLVAECDERAGTSKTSEYCTTYTYAGYQMASRSWYYQNGKKATEKWRYNNVGQVIEHEDPEGRITKYQYYTQKTTNSAGTVVYGMTGDLRYITHPSGLQEAFHYTNWGQVRKSHMRDSTAKSWDVLETKTYHNTHGSLQDTYGPIISEVLDSSVQHQARERRYWDAELQVNRIDVTDTKSSTPLRRTDFTFDRLGRETSRKLPAVLNENGATIYPTLTTEYDKNGNIEKQCDARTICTTRTYDDRNQLLTVVRDGKTMERYWYWDEGTVQKFRDAANRETYYRYNRSGDRWLLMRRNGTSGAWNVQEHVYFVPDTRLTAKIAAGGAYRGPYKQVVEFTYHPNDTIHTEKETIEGGDRTTTTLYNVDGKTASVTVSGTGGSDKTTFGYNSWGALTSTTVDADGLALKTTTNYDKRGRLYYRIDPEGNRSDYRYDLAGNLIREYTAQTDYYQPYATVPKRVRLQTRFEYDAFGNRTTTLEHGVPIANAPKTTYDRLDRVIRVDYPVVKDSDGVTHNATESVWYDANGNLAKEQNRLGGITTHTYNNLDQLIETNDAEGNVSKFINDNVGNVKQSTDPDGRKMTYTYDYWGNVLTAKVHLRAFNYAGGGTAGAQVLTTTYTYDSLGNPASVDTPELPIATTEYDAASRLVKSTDAGGEVTTMTYNFRDQVTRTDRPGNYDTVTVYDSAGRVDNTRELGPNGSQLARTTLTHDDNGNVLTQTSAAGVKTTYTYDEVNRVKTTSLNAVSPAVVTTFGYDLRGNLAYLKDGEGNVTTTYYNYWNLPSVVREPVTANASGAANRDRHSRYDDAGNLRQTALPGGVKIDYVHDKLSRPTREASGSAWREFDYDGASNVTATRASNAPEVRFRHNDANWLMESEYVGVAGSRATFEYDGDGRMTKRTDPKAVAPDVFAWTDRNQLDTHTQGAIHADYTWNAAGNLARVDFGNDVGYRELRYATNGRLYRDDWRADTKLRSRRQYGYDSDSRVTFEKVLQHGHDWSEHRYAYDKADRLEQFTIRERINGSYPTNPQTTIDYRYDAAGNRTHRITNGTTERWTYNERNQVATAPGGATYTYTPRGTLSRIVRNGGTEEYTFDGFGQTVAYSGPAGSVGYVYDGLGRLEQRSSAGGTENFLYSGAARDASALVADSGGEVGADAVEWVARPHCATDGTTAVSAEVRNDRTSTVAVQMEMRENNDAGTVRHAVHTHTIAAGDTLLLTLGGVPAGTWNFVITIDGVDQQPTKVHTVTALNCSSDTVAIFGQPDCATNPTDRATLRFSVTNKSATSRNYVLEVGPHGHDPLTVGANSTRQFVLKGIPDGEHTPKVKIGNTVVAEHVPLTFACGPDAGSSTTHFGRSPSGVLRTYGQDGDINIAAVDRYGDLMHLADPASAMVIETMAYEPFGTIINQWGAEADPVLGFQGDYTDPISGNVSMDARWYQADSGTFTSRDSFSGDASRALSFNKYAYAGNNPIKYWDPTGYDWDVHCNCYVFYGAESENTGTSGTMKFYADGSTEHVTHTYNVNGEPMLVKEVTDPLGNVFNPSTRPAFANWGADAADLELAKVEVYQAAERTASHWLRSAPGIGTGSAPFVDVPHDFTYITGSQPPASDDLQALLALLGPVTDVGGFATDQQREDLLRGIVIATENGHAAVNLVSGRELSDATRASYHSYLDSLWGQMASSDAERANLQAFGRALGAAGVLVDGYEVVNGYRENGWAGAGEAVVDVAAGWGGAKVGAMVCAPAGPPGILVCGIGGAYLGPEVVDAAVMMGVGMTELPGIAYEEFQALNPINGLGGGEYNCRICRAFTGPFGG